MQIYHFLLLIRNVIRQRVLAACGSFLSLFSLRVKCFARSLCVAEHLLLFFCSVHPEILDIIGGFFSKTYEHIVEALTAS